MCQTNVYLNNELYQENVVHMEFAQKAVKIVTLFDAPRVLEADIISIDLLKGRVNLETIKRP